MNISPGRGPRGRHRFLASGLATTLTLFGGTLFAQDKPLSVGNASLEVTFDSVKGRLSMAAKPSGRIFLKDVRLLGDTGSASITNLVDPKFGDARAMVIDHRNGARDTVMLFEKLPFALIRGTLRNPDARPLVTRKVKTLSAVLDLGKTPSELKSFGTGGLLALDKNPGSYAWLAVVEPYSRDGVVLGWLTSDRGSGVAFTGVEAAVPRIETQIDYGRLKQPPTSETPLETLAIGYFDDARLGLEAYADAVAKWHDVHLPPQPVGYCTWYSRPYGGSSDEKHLAELAIFAAKHLTPFGFSVIQIDDHWQAGVSTNGPKRNFSSHAENGSYPAGMKAAASQLKSVGMTPGLWFMPFAGTYYDPYFKDHQDWFVRLPDGRPYETAWGGTCLDMTDAGAREFVLKNVERIAKDWGYTYFKMDGLWTGTATRQQYVNSGYKDDGMGDAIFENPDKTNLEAFRDGLRLIREAAGTNVFILGCNGPQNMRSYAGAFGLVDAMRIGPDNGPEWTGLIRGPTFGSRHYFLNGRVWYNDPDPIYVRESVPLNRARLVCSWVAISGQLNMCSEWLPGLPAERLDILKRTMPSHGLFPRPADLFDRDVPRLWLVSDERQDIRRDVVGVFNWQSETEKIDYPVERMGLDPRLEYEVFDFWAGALRSAFKTRLQLEVPPESCLVLSVRPRANHPQVLSTSRHILQGMVDLTNEKWDETTRTLSGVSRVVGGDPYELRISTRAEAESVTLSEADVASGVTVRLAAEPILLRATLESAANREVSWAVKFK